MNEYIYCGFWRRVAATVLNKIIMIVIILPIASLSFLLPESNTFRGIILLLCMILFVPICESSSLQAAPGGYILKMKIINKDGTQVGFVKSLFRFITLALINGTFFLAIISIACMMCSREKAFLHDMIFGTRMVMR